MSKSVIYLFLPLFLFISVINLYSLDESASPTDSVLGKRKAKTESDKRILRIEQIVYSFVVNGSDLKEEQTKELILKKVNDEFPLAIEKSPKEVNIVKLRKRAQKQANKKYQLTEKELTEQYNKKAEELFQSLPLNSTVTITYKQGSNLKTITGRYFGLTYYNDGVRIENTVIPIFDMSDSDKSKFDAKLRDLKKRQYVKDEIESYQKEKESYSDNIIRTKAEEVVKLNEKNGFINAWSKWRTPEDVAEIIITYIVDKERKKEEESNKANQPPIVKEGIELQKRPIDSGIADQVQENSVRPPEEENW
ncbi:MAG TPA: hypothetical protein DD381_00145 [Lentisphaeria bacterium]|nr:MAG: hypothetical protein A2X47_12955 [Lentisphaerae bacterium GWF2_38_69]HBM14751.1 hypothetical protein [Lentisphaeria bacterium]